MVIVHFTLLSIFGFVCSLISFRDAKLITDLGLKLIWGINTHCHADHITGTHKLKSLLPGCRSCISEKAGAAADWKFVEGDVIRFGSRHLHVLETPGHTNVSQRCCHVDFASVLRYHQYFRNCPTYVMV